jgi:hypothetical protein
MLHYTISAIIFVVLIWAIIGIVKDIKQIHDDTWNEPPTY